MALMGVTPQEFADMGYWESEAYGRALIERQDAEIEFRVKLAMLAAGAKVV